MKLNPENDLALIECDNVSIVITKTAPKDIVNFLHNAITRRNRR
ncbi:MAG: hypothetical protein PHP22_10295 [Oscillospiraceae bacterium]|nr:hypothetical protein [Oscillospiraceae bacterium]